MVMIHFNSTCLLETMKPNCLTKLIYKVRTLCTLACCAMFYSFCVAYSLYEREEFSECLIYLYQQIHSYIGDLSCLRILLGNCYHKQVSIHCICVYSGTS